MRSNGPLANKEVAIGGHGWPWVARSSGVAESGRLVRRMSHRVDPAAIAEEARTVRLDAVLGPPRRSVPVGDSSTPESRTLTPLIMVRIQVNPRLPIRGNPTAEWLARQITEAFPWDTAPKYLIRDNDRAFGGAFKARVRAMGVRDRPTSFRRPGRTDMLNA